MKNYFLKKRVITNIFIFLLVTTMISFKLFLVVLLLSLLILYIYRKRTLSNVNNKDIELNSVFSPITGKVKKIAQADGKTIVSISPKIFGPLGVYMPFSGSIDESENSETVIYNKLGNRATLSFSLGLFKDSNIWLRSGDLAKCSSNIGFLGFGGSINILLNDESKILIDKGQKVFAGQSLIAGFEVNNE